MEHVDGKYKMTHENTHKPKNKNKHIHNRHTRHNRKKNVILDFDETLFYAIDMDDYIPEKHDEKISRFKTRPVQMDDSYKIILRPGLHKFLDYVFKNFNVTTFTAASKSYAMFILDNIIKRNNTDRKVDYVFFSYHCDLSKCVKNGIKDLTIIWDIFKLPGYNKYNTLIIDDNQDVKDTGYCIQVPEFNFFNEGSENDNYFDKLIEKLEVYRDLPDDVQYEF